MPTKPNHWPLRLRVLAASSIALASITLGACATSATDGAHRTAPVTADDPAIEFLRFKVKPGIEQKFLEADDQIWTVALRRSPAFIKKETWIKPGGGEVVIVAHWTSRKAWHSLPPEWFTGIEERFAAAIGGAENFSMIESVDYSPVPIAPPK